MLIAPVGVAEIGFTALRFLAGPLVVLLFFSFQIQSTIAYRGYGGAISQEFGSTISEMAFQCTREGI